jgi:3-methylcrotonyl-CoA carboxylase alpha subunit
VNDRGIELESGGGQRRNLRWAFEGEDVILLEDGAEIYRGRVIVEDEGQVIISDGEGRKRFVLCREGDLFHIVSEGRAHRIRRARLDAAAVGEGDDANEASLVAPMVGKVVKVLAQAGDEVADGDAVVVVEAMKMEHQLRAPFAARVTTLDCAEGDQVDMGQVLARLERRDEED